MNQYYKVVARVENEVENTKGKIKTKVVSEQYLVEAVSPTDAEAKTHSHLSGIMSDFEVISIVLTKILDIIY